MVCVIMAMEQHTILGSYHRSSGLRGIVIFVIHPLSSLGMKACLGVCRLGMVWAPVTVNTLRGAIFTFGEECDDVWHGQVSERTEFCCRLRIGIDGLHLH